MISIQSLVKSYQMGRSRVQALDGLDLEIPDRSFVAVLGPSGSGKSTLLNLIGGLDRPSSGSIEVEGRALESLDEDELADFRRGTIGFVFQSFNLIATMDARENVAFPLRFAGIRRAERLLRADVVIQEVGLQERWNHRPTELSGGQQQRVALARALINNPRIILADEPTGNLDSATGAQILEMLAGLHHQGRTIVVVSHDPRVMHYATDRVFLLDGRRVAEREYQRALSVSGAVERSIR